MNQLDITIMGQVYKLACKKDEQAALIQAAAYLDGKMTVLRDSARLKGNDRIAVMAALSIAAEFLAVKSPAGPLSDLGMAEIKQQIHRMTQVLDAAISPE